MIKNNLSEVSDSDFYFGTSTKLIIMQSVLTLSALYSSICVSTGLSRSHGRQRKNAVCMWMNVVIVLLHHCLFISRAVMFMRNCVASGCFWPQSSILMKKSCPVQQLCQREWILDMDIQVRYSFMWRLKVLYCRFPKEHYGNRVIVADELGHSNVTIIYYSVVVLLTLELNLKSS